MTNGITFEEALEHDRVVGYQEPTPWGVLRVESYGNCALINDLAQSSNIRLGNVSTYAPTSDDLKVKVKVNR